VNVNDIGNGENDPWVGKGDHSYMLKGHRTGNQIEFFVYSGGWQTAHADVGDSFNGVWHHVAGTFDGSQLKIYVDGALMVTSDFVGGIDPSVHNVAIGTNTESGGRFSEGIHDEVMIYNRALSAGEVMYLAGYRETFKIEVENPSFELPGTEKMEMDGVPGWTAATGSAGVETDWEPTDGDWTAYIGAGAVIYNLTDHAIQTGEVYYLAFDAKETSGGQTLLGELYADVDGERVVLATVTCDLTSVPGGSATEDRLLPGTTFYLDYAADDNTDYIGRQLGIQFTVAAGSWTGLDNIRLEYELAG